VIAEVDSDSPAGKAGLREGDVIQEVNKQRVKSAKDLVAASKKLKPNEKILIRVYSQGRSGYVAGAEVNIKYPKALSPSSRCRVS
jgi:serine protease Do